MSEAPVSKYWDAESSAVMPPPAAASARPATGPAAPFAPPEPRVPYAAPPAMPSLGPFGPEPRKRRRISVRGVVAALGVVAVIAAGVVAYPKLETRLHPSSSVPADLHAFTLGSDASGSGVTFAPAGEGYSIRLPAQPVQHDARPNNIAIVSGGDYEIVVRERRLPVATATVLPYGLVGAVYDPALGGSQSAVAVHAVTVAGHPAYDFNVRLTGGPPFASRVILDGRRLISIRVQSKGSSAVLVALERSLRLTR